MQYVHTYQSPLGELTMLSDGSALTELVFDTDRYYPAEAVSAAQQAMLPVFEQTQAWLECYFAGQQPDFLPPLALHGTAFQQEVWQLLLEIPYGQLVTYGELAQQLARRRGAAHMSAQAVGGAVGRNPVCILVPCHRVVGTGGSLTGYAAGIGKKIRLLEREGVDMQKLFVPKRGTAL